jgi:hypothetical protein
VRKTAQSAVAALVLACAAVASGCGGAAQSAPGPAPEAPPGGAPFLATSLVTGAGTWAVAVMGGSVATHNDFWQLFVRPAGSAAWKLVTPPGVASNGGLVVADAGGRSLISGLRPSQYLTYTPLAITRNGGQAWSPTGPLDGALANVPDALAAAPGTGHLLALLTSGTTELAAPGYTRWLALASRRALAATPAGRRCGLGYLTAAAFSPAGVPLLAGTCRHPGTTGIFALRNGTWQAAGPPLPGALGRDVVTVLRLTLAGNRTAALLKVGRGSSASLLAAWSADGGAQWAVSAPLRLGRERLSGASFAPAGMIVQNGAAAGFIPADGGAWQSLPAVPPGTATVAPGPAGGFDALAVHRTRLTVWQLGPGSATWRATQVLNVPIQFGSSG